MEPIERAVKEQQPLDLTSGRQPAPGTEDVGEVEPGFQPAPPTPPTEQSPWNPSNFKWIAFLASFLASGILAGINWRRLGQPQRAWPTILATIGGSVLFVAILTLLPDSSNGAKYLGYAVNVIVGYGLARWQQPAYNAYNITYRASTLKSSGNRIPVLVSLGSIVVIFIMSIGLGIAWDQVQNSHIYQGNTYFDQENYSQAIEEYNQAAAISPNTAEIYNNRGVAYLRLKDYQNALTDFTRATQLDPQSALAYRNRSLANLGLGKYDSALNDITVAIPLNPQSADSFFVCGMIYVAINETDKAITDLEKAIDLGLNDSAKQIAETRLQSLKQTSH